MTGGTSELLDDVAFDHDAAFRASWAIDEALRALDDLADARARLAADILCSCSGPYAEALRSLARLLARQAARESFARFEISDEAPPKEKS